MPVFNGKYRYNKIGSGGGTTTTLTVKASTETEAWQLILNHAQNKHPEHQITIMEINGAGEKMSSYSIKYKYNKPGSGSSTTTTFSVRANSNMLASQLAQTQAENKHPGCQVTILEVKKI